MTHNTNGQSVRTSDFDNNAVQTAAIPAMATPSDSVIQRVAGNPEDLIESNPVLSQAVRMMQAVIRKAQEGGTMGVLGNDSVEAMAQIKTECEPTYLRTRERLRQANPKAPLFTLDKLVGLSVSSSGPVPTHAGYAQAMVQKLTVKGWQPIGHEGSLFVLNSESDIWERMPRDRLERAITDAYDGRANCKRRGDYTGIAQQTISMAGTEDVFSCAPVGLAGPDGFYRIDGDELKVEALSPEHRQRVRLSFSPVEMPTPMFNTFMFETFTSATDDEMVEQVRLLQEVAGATMLGIMCRYEKAIMFYDPFGRAGKGTTERILRQLVPPNFITAVSPMDWTKEYYLASLIGTRLNVAGELSYDRAVPEKVFKTVLGRDLVTGRNPTEKPIKFRNEAAHLFMSNHLVSPTEQDEGFFARWLLIEFPNSRTRSGAEIDTNLAEKIIAAEMPGIAYWALEGAKRLLKNGKFSSSLAHDRLMEKWRRRGSSLIEFIHEECILGESHSERRSNFYREYANWCPESGHKAYSKARVRDTLEHNLPLGIRLASLNGHEIFRGVMLKSTKLIDDRF